MLLIFQLLFRAPRRKTDRSARSALHSCFQTCCHYYYSSPPFFWNFCHLQQSGMSKPSGLSDISDIHRSPNKECCSGSKSEGYEGNTNNACHEIFSSDTDGHESSSTSDTDGHENDNKIARSPTQLKTKTIKTLVIKSLSPAVRSKSDVIFPSLFCGHRDSLLLMPPTIMTSTFSRPFSTPLSNTPWSSSAPAPTPPKPLAPMTLSIMCSNLFSTHSFPHNLASGSRPSTPWMTRFRTSGSTDEPRSLKSPWSLWPDQPQCSISLSYYAPQALHVKIPQEQERKDRMVDGSFYFCFYLMYIYLSSSWTPVILNVMVSVRANYVSLSVVLSEDLSP